MIKSEYIGCIKMFAGNYCPDGYLYCDGQLLTIPTNLMLFNVIGTHYGGDGQTTFAVPKLNDTSADVKVKYIICASGIYPSR